MGTGDRVTILGLNYAPEPSGNAPYTAALARHLAQRGAHITVLTSFPHYPQWERSAAYGGWRSEQDVDGVRVVRLRHLIPRPPRGLRRLASELTFGVRTALAAWNRPDTVVLVSPALFSSWLAMIRLLVQRHPRRVVWVQDLYSQGMAETGEGGGASIRIARLVEGWTLRRAHEVVAIHETMATRMTTSLNVDRERVTVIANWSHVTPSALDPSAARARLGWEDVFTVLHAGNMGRKQGLENVVEAARLADAQGVPVRIVLLGDGSERADLERLASACPTLAFEDPVAEDDFPTALAAADALLLNEAPSVREMAVPSKLTSYFAAARPVVFAVEPEGVVAGLAKAAGAGITVRSGDPAALLGAVRELSADSHMRERLGKSAVEYWTERFSPEQALAQWERLVRHHPKTRSSAS